ncbi:hypothetical protein F5882DRAFT_379216 [Hyaloscypha sp. PMI_1271]|nr:hypothetical protein F5882DRAFT_379216 [Hyaloscypha sp. PMI_1271]
MEMLGVLDCESVTTGPHVPACVNCKPYKIDRLCVRACVRANTSTGTRAAVNGLLYCRQELAMTQWSFVCAIFPVVLKGGVDRPGVRFAEAWKPGSLKRRSVSMRGLTGDHGKTDGYDVPDAYDATTPIFRRSTAAVEGKGMTGSTAPGGCRLSVEGGGQPATNPNLEKQAHRSTGGPTTSFTPVTRSRPSEPVDQRPARPVVQVQGARSMCMEQCARCNVQGPMSMSKVQSAGGSSRFGIGTAKWTQSDPSCVPSMYSKRVAKREAWQNGGPGQDPREWPSGPVR